MIFFSSCWILPTSNKNPAFPLIKISLGPVGQFEDIMGFFKNCASKRTFGRPSYLEDKIKKSALFKYGYGFFL